MLANVNIATQLDFEVTTYVRSKQLTLTRDYQSVREPKHVVESTFLQAA
jgi:hypothetical protein